jgi:subfamily B ATP-binding cassette protein MsbA
MSAEGKASGGYARLWRDWMRPHWRLLALAALCMAVMAAAASGYAKLIELVTDAFDAGRMSAMYWGPAAVIVLTLTKGAAQYAETLLANRAIGQVETALKRRMFRDLVAADLARLAQEPPAAMASRFAGDISLIGSSVKVGLTGASQVLVILFTFAVMMTIDWALTLVLVVIFSAAILPVGRIGRRVRDLSRKTQGEVARMTAEVTEGLAGIRMARTYQLEVPLAEGADRVFDALYALRMKAANWAGRTGPLMEVLAGLAVAALLFIVGLRMQGGTLTLSEFLGLLTGLGIAANPARRLGGVWATLQQGRAALERVYALFDAENRVLEPADPVPMGRARGALSFAGVGFAYPSGRRALDGVTLDVPAGARVALVGRSGAGKTTVFNLIPRLYDPTEGRITLDGIDLRALSLADLRRQIAVVGQDSVLLTGTVADNIGFGRPGADRTGIEAAARDAAAHDFISALPEGYDTPVVPSAGQFSGGERQRLSIARAILRDAPVLLLDEPTSALDAQSEALIRAALARLEAGRTTLVIAHRLATVLDADLIVVMEDGRIAETGTHADLLARDGLYAGLYRLQFAG